MKVNDFVKQIPNYKPGLSIEEIAKVNGFRDYAELVQLSANENPFGPSPKAVEAMVANASKMNRYPDGEVLQLKRKLAAKLGVDLSNLMLGNGSNEIIELLGHLYLSKESNWVISQASFAVYTFVAHLCESKAIAVPMLNFTHDLEAMLEAITPETRVVIVCNPNNPTGTIVSKQKIYEFIEKLPENVLAVFDEAYYEYMPDDDKPDLIGLIKKGQKNIVVLRTFSKIYGLAGLRIGYAIAAPEIIALLDRVRQPYNVNRMAQEAAIAALDDNDHLKMVRESNFLGLEYLEEMLPTIGNGLDYISSVANFIMIKVGNAKEIAHKLQLKKIFVAPMDAYGFTEWIRATVGTPEQNQAFLFALKEILG